MEHGGAVIATTIDKYCYISCRTLPPFFDHKHRIVYSKIEDVGSVADIEHPAVRAVMQWADVRDGLEIHHDGDLPARSGLGSSSAFTVGLVHALNAMRGRLSDKLGLACDALFIEQQLIGESVGSQDQICAAYGGFNRIDFSSSGSFAVSPVILPALRTEELQKHLLLFFTGVSRIANEIAKSQIINFKSRKSELTAMRGMVDESISILSGVNTPITEFGQLLDENWRYKRSLSSKVSTPEIDNFYRIARNAGALGGKILGAGGGGFLLLFADPTLHEHIHRRLGGLVKVPVRFEDSGSKVVLYQPQGL